MLCTVRTCSSQFFRIAQARGFARKLANLYCVSSIHRSLKQDVHTLYQTRSNTILADNQEALMVIWPDLVREVTEDERFQDASEVMQWLAKMLKYNIPNYTKHALSLVSAYEKLVPEDQLTEENLRLARILGWCCELWEIASFILDDIIDQSDTRWGQDCWYKQRNVGLGAINDGVVFLEVPFNILKRHFREKPCYLNLVETFHEATTKATIGQIMEGLGINFGNKPNLDLFTMDRYSSIVKYKTGCLFIMSIKLAMHLAGIRDLEMFRQAETIMLRIGHFQQVQNDYLDCFGDQQVKVGTDIQRGICSWLVVVALERASLEQRKILYECYGKDDATKVAKVKQLYNDLGLQLAYSIYEEESYNLISTSIQHVSCGLPHGLFFKCLEQVYNRKLN